MKIGEWLREEGLTLHEGARRLGISNAALLHKYVHGTAMPKRRNMRLIIKGTGGRVGPADFYAEERTAE